MSDEANQILSQAADVQDTKAKLKTARELQKEHLEQIDEYNAMQDAKLVAKGLEDKLKLKLNSDSEYNNRQEHISELKHDLADQEDILSIHLIAYRDKTKDESIEVDDVTERPIYVSARLGKERDIQTEMDFSQDN